jgi:hypothetical protein
MKILYFVVALKFVVHLWNPQKIVLHEWKVVHRIKTIYFITFPTEGFMNNVNTLPCCLVLIMHFILHQLIVYSTIDLQGHCGFPSFPVVDWFCLFVDLWVLPFCLKDCSVFGNFVITLIYTIKIPGHYFEYRWPFSSSSQIIQNSMTDLVRDWCGYFLTFL